MPDLSDLLRNHPGLSSCESSVAAARDALIDGFAAGHTLYLCGNGGSAADCGHIVGELRKGFCRRRPLSEPERLRLQAAARSAGMPSDGALLAAGLQGGLPAISLVTEPAFLSAFANDVNADLVFAQQVAALGRAGDMLLCLSTSGQSRNVVLAALAARAQGLKTIALTGEKPSQLSAICDITVQVPASETYRIQEYHLPVYHYLCAAVEAHFWSV